LHPKVKFVRTNLVNSASYEQDSIRHRLIFQLLYQISQQRVILLHKVVSLPHQ
jgi:hypothetical protein